MFAAGRTTGRRQTSSFGRELQKRGTIAEDADCHKPEKKKKEDVGTGTPQRDGLNPGGAVLPVLIDVEGASKADAGEICAGAEAAVTSATNEGASTARQMAASMAGQPGTAVLVAITAEKVRPTATTQANSALAQQAGPHFTAANICIPPAGKTEPRSKPASSDSHSQPASTDCKGQGESGLNNLGVIWRDVEGRRAIQNAAIPRSVLANDGVSKTGDQASAAQANVTAEEAVSEQTLPLDSANQATDAAGTQVSTKRTAEIFDVGVESGESISTPDNQTIHGGEDLRETHPVTIVAELMPPVSMAMDGPKVAGSAQKAFTNLPESDPKTSQVPGATEAAPEHEKDLPTKAHCQDKRRDIEGLDAQVPPANSPVVGIPASEPKSGGESAVSQGMAPAAHSGQGVQPATKSADTISKPHADVVSPTGADPAVAPSLPLHAQQAVRILERAGQSELHIGLHSPGMGTIDVKTVLHDNNLAMSIGVDRREIQSALLSELPSLANTLRNQDLRLGEVRFHDSSALLNFGSGGGQQRQSREPVPSYSTSLHDGAQRDSLTSEVSAELIQTTVRSGISVRV